MKRLMRYIQMIEKEYVAIEKNDETFLVENFLCANGLASC